MAAAGIAAALLLLAVALLPGSASAATGTQNTFGAGASTVSRIFGSCQSTQNFSTVSLPYDADVTYALLMVSTMTNMTGKTGWIALDVGADGTVVGNITLDSSTTSTYANITTDSWDAYIAAQNLSSGNVSVPIRATSCPPAGGWNITLSNLDVRYTYGSGAQNAPVFAGTIPDLSMAEGGVRTSAVTASSYFSDPDGDTLTYSVVPGNAADAGWSYVTATFNGAALRLTASAGWTGNLAFLVQATDTTSRTALSNNINLTVTANTAPYFEHPPVEDLVVGTNDTVSAFPEFTDDENDRVWSRLVAVDPNAAGWSNLYIRSQFSGWGVLGDGLNLTHELSPTSWFAHFYINNPGNWSGTVQAYIRLSDTFGHSNDSNVFTITANAMHACGQSLSDVVIAPGTTDTGAVDLADICSDPDGDTLTFSVLDEELINVTYTTPIFVSVNGGTLDIGSSNSSWTGSDTYRIRACDGYSRCTTSGVLTVRVEVPSNGAPAYVASIGNFSMAPGTTEVDLLDGSDYFTDPDGDTLYYAVTDIDSSLVAAATSFTWNGSRLTIVNDPDSPWSGTFCFHVAAYDAASQATTTSGSVCLHVEPSQNAPPRPAGPLPDVEAAAGSDGALSVDIASLFTDDQGASRLRFTVAEGPEAAWSSANLTVIGTVVSLDFAAPLAPTDVTFTITATDHWGGSYTTAPITLHILAKPGNSAPTLEADYAVTVDYGQTATLDIGATARDIDGDAITWSIAAPIAGISVDVDRATGLLTVIAPSAGPRDTYTISVIATDTWGASARADVTVRLRAPPVALPVGAHVLMNGAAPADVDVGATLVFALDLASIDPAISIQWYLDDVFLGEGPSASVAAVAAGPHTVKARLSNGPEEGFVTQAFTVRVPPQPPVQTGPGSGLLSTALILGLAMVGAFVGLSERGRYFIVFAALGSVFARLKKDSLLDHFVRGRLYQAISDTPGIHLAELRRRAMVAHGTAIHHLHVLEKGGYITAVPSGSLTRFYPTDQPLDDEIYGLNDSDRAVLSVVAEAPGITQGDLSARLERSPSTVSRSVNRLEKLGYVVTEQRGRATAVFPRPGAQSAGGPAPAWARPGR